MHGAWNEAVKRFLREINDTQGTPITSWRELTDVWIKVANETLVETHRTPEFLEAQRRLTRSGAECRLQEREIAEAFCEMQQMPTRTEMDEVQREVYELRRRLRALEKVGGGRCRSRNSFAKRDEESARRGARRACRHDPRLEDAADELPHSIRSIADCEAVRRLQPASAARQRIAALGQGPGRADRHHAQDRGLPAGQDDALPLRADGQANRCSARAGRLRPGRALHDGRSAGGSFADPQSAPPGRRPVCRRLGQSRSRAIGG